MRKTSVGTWDKDSNGTALRHIKKLDFEWYYNWSTRPLWNPGIVSRAQFVPMIWGLGNIDDALPPDATELLGFNEPDDKRQSNMSVTTALTVWPKLEATGKRLGSPAPTTDGLWWLSEFMRGKPKVDFICVHHYTHRRSPHHLRNYLVEVYRRWGLPIWLTEWARVDWNDPSRFRLDQEAVYARDAFPVLEALPFVERHAWFAMYTGSDGWHINTELFDATNRITRIGRVFKRRAP